VAFRTTRYWPIVRPICTTKNPDLVVHLYCNAIMFTSGEEALRYFLRPDYLLDRGLLYSSGLYCQLLPSSRHQLGLGSDVAYASPRVGLHLAFRVHGQVGLFARQVFYDFAILAIACGQFDPAIPGALHSLPY